MKAFPVLFRPRAAALLFAAGLALAFVPATGAKTVSPTASGAAIEACLLSDDHRPLENSTHFGCCSKDAGICVICPKPPSAGNRCEVIAHRTNIPGMNVASPGKYENLLLNR